MLLNFNTTDNSLYTEVLACKGDVIKLMCNVVAGKFFLLKLDLLLPVSHIGYTVQSAAEVLCKPPLVEWLIWNFQS